MIKAIKGWLLLEDEYIPKELEFNLYSFFLIIRLGLIIPVYLFLAFLPVAIVTLIWMGIGYGIYWIIKWIGG